MNASIALLVFAIVGWGSYLPVSRSPRLRATMWPTLALLGLALGAEVALIFCRTPGGERVNGLDVVTLATVFLFLPVYVFALRVPRSASRVLAGQALPAVRFISENGAAISSVELTQRGPLLLIFFRGFW